ncbi:meteorin-like protein [Gigantopelta aegis]|uniref:meteorin-like protein n=1 Tax=Gigantopelta aegis TaxID=1735272 RepID=UPI001B88E0D4|nr:meteorin-like protein [Gigantopelta aegis]
MDTRRLVSVVLLFLMGVVRVRQQHTCDQCDCTVGDSDDDRGITNVRPRCSEGKITWSSSYGAIRLELRPIRPGEFKACILLHSHDVRTLVSRETVKYTPGNYKTKTVEKKELTLSPLLTVNGSGGRDGKEVCATSSGDSVHLYIETVRTTEDTGLPRVTIYYDIEMTKSPLFYNPMDDCRPCTDKELIEAFCTSEFVVVGQMQNVVHSKADETSYIDVQVSHVVRQKDRIFTPSPRSSRDLEGTILTPSKCDVSLSSGHFLLTGRVRLGRPVLKCAPFYDQWLRIRDEAKQSGMMECA